MSLKLAIITSTRAEYGIFYPLIKVLLEDNYFDLHLLVTGTHLCEKYGHTVDFIKKDGIPIAYEVPILTSEGTNVAEISRALIKFEAIYIKEQYDAIMVLGDRYELFGFCIPAMLHRIPIIHLHGGEKTEGALDEKIRHSITKLASIHFPSLPEYAKRIVQMGENPNYVWAVGALGIDNILNQKLIGKEVLEKDLGITDLSLTAIVTFHPITSKEGDQMIVQTKEVFNALVDVNLNYIVTCPNSDYGSDQINEVIKNYEQRYPDRFKVFKSLGQIRYLSSLKYCRMVIGNSSSGIIEAPSFKIPTIDIGDRQQGRFSPESVLHTPCVKHDIVRTIKKAMSSEFQAFLGQCTNPYGDGRTAERIRDRLKSIDFKNPNLIKKKFYDMQG